MTLPTVTLSSWAGIVPISYWLITTRKIWKNASAVRTVRPSTPYSCSSTVQTMP